MRTIALGWVFSGFAATKVLLPSLFRLIRQWSEGSALMFAVTVGLVRRPAASTEVESLSSHYIHCIGTALGYHLRVVVCLRQGFGVTCRR